MLIYISHHNFDKGIVICDDTVLVKLAFQIFCFSRQVCGPVTEGSAVLLFHTTSCPPPQLPILLAVAKGLVEEQFINITSFNIVRYIIIVTLYIYFYLSNSYVKFEEVLASDYHK